MIASSKCPWQNSGFTLLELLVVISLIAVLAAVVVPNLAGNSGRDVSAAAQRLVLLVNQAQQEAVLSSKVWQIIFDPVEQHYRFAHPLNNEPEPVSEEPFAGEHSLDPVALDELVINGEPMSQVGEVYLFPTGENDPFQLVLKAGEHQRMVVMGPVGEAYIESISVDE